MDIGFLRVIDRFVGLPLCWVFCLLRQWTRTGDSEGRRGKFHIILLSQMGSLVLAYTMFEALEEKYPEASIHVLLFEQNREFLEVLQAVPASRILTVRNDSLPILLP